MPHNVKKFKCETSLKITVNVDSALQLGYPTHTHRVTLFGETVRPKTLHNICRNGRQFMFQNHLCSGTFLLFLSQADSAHLQP